VRWRGERWGGGMLRGGRRGDKVGRFQVNSRKSVWGGDRPHSGVW